jgi:hypothetical protein
MVSGEEPTPKIYSKVISYIRPSREGMVTENKINDLQSHPLLGGAI